VGSATANGQPDDRSPLSVDERDGVLHAALHHPPGNTLGPPVVAALSRLVERFEHSQAKVLVLSSALPECFAAGPDVAHLTELSAQGFADYRDAVRRPLARLEACRRPSIAVIDGSAHGSGLDLAMACTLRFASSRARLALPEVAMGLVPGGGATQRLPDLVGRGHALELMLTGREIRGDEAWRIGLVDRLIYGDVLAESLGIARDMAGQSAAAMAGIVACVDAARDLPHDSGMAVEGVAVLSAFEERD
jgi:enoyl-CoA hydratase